MCRRDFFLLFTIYTFPPRFDNTDKLVVRLQLFFLLDQVIKWTKEKAVEDANRVAAKIKNWKGVSKFDRLFLKMEEMNVKWRGQCP